MRHKIDKRKLNKKGAHLRSMLANMAVSLIEHESIKTTLPKAKELRRYIEPLITVGRQQTLAARRRVSSKLHQQAQPTRKLMNELTKRFAQRPGGYVRVLKAGIRPGDTTPMAVIQFVDYQETLQKKEELAQQEESAVGKTAKTLDVQATQSEESQEKK